MKVTKASLGIGDLHFSNSPARRHTKRCCQTNEPKHQYLVDGYFYEITKERHSVRWDGCRPPQTASQCANIVVLNATRRGGR